MAEWFFDDHPGPVAAFFLRQAAIAQHLGDRREESRSDRQIEKPVSLRAMELVSLVNLILQSLVRFRILKIATDIVDALSDAIPVRTGIARPASQSDRCFSMQVSLGNRYSGAVDPPQAC